MISRCYQPGATSYKEYGGSGILVCKRWHKFTNFLEDMGELPTPKHTLDRINNSKGYSKDNCRWATRKEQAINRRDTRLFTFDGKTMSIRDWARHIGMARNTLYERLNTSKMPFEKAITTPVLKRKRR